MQILSWNINGLKACLKSDSFNLYMTCSRISYACRKSATQEKPMITFRSGRCKMEDIGKENDRCHMGNPISQDQYVDIISSSII